MSLVRPSVDIMVACLAFGRGRRGASCSQWARILGLLLPLLAASSAWGQPSAIEASSRLWTGSSARPTVTELAAYDICVLPATADLSQMKGHPAGQLLLARLDPVEAVPGVREKAQAQGIAMIASATRQGAPRLDTESPRWQEFALNEVAGPAIAAGFDGWVLEGAAATVLTPLAKALRTRHPDKWIFVTDTTSFLKDGAGIGLWVQGTAGEMAAQEERIRAATAQGMPVLAVVTEAPDPAQAATHLAELKAVPFVTTPDLSGHSLAPLKERSRNVLVLYGWDPKQVEKPQTLPIDTMTSELFQTPLEYLGYETVYHNIAEAPLPRHPEGRYAAILLDAEMQVPGEMELPMLEWLVKAKDAGVRVLFMGAIPFSSDDGEILLKDAFGLRGSLATLPRVKNVTVAFSDAELMRGEVPFVPKKNEFRDLQAPADGRALLSLASEDARFEPAFLAPWGGMWLEPCVILRGSQDASLFHADPYKLLPALLGNPSPLPAPDTTTRDGRRLFYSHIDGDGFASLTDFRGHPFCGEVVRDRVLKAFPIPVTVSVVEADITASAEGVQDAWRDKLTEAARSIFALPNIQIASHSYSHPYLWDPQDPNPGIYTETNMPMKAAARYPRIDLAREIRGSVEYINRELAPKDKRLELFLWSGNCRPGHAALKMVREMGVENMNGGNTIISRQYPGIAGVAPRVMPWGDELQINAANQNEFMYANGWNGPFYGGFADVIDTFERTETPRRLKPVNVYYHFYSATCLSSLRALEKIHRWCMERPLHPVTALQFALMAKDASRTRVYDLGPNHWLLANAGHLRTFRLPASLGEPDMEHSKGITGWAEFQGSLYIHTSGGTRTELLMQPAIAEPPSDDKAHLHLAASDAEIRFSSLESRAAAFTVEGLRPSTVEFAGLPARTVCALTINQAAATFTADDRGHLTLALPATAAVTLEASRPPHAVLQ